jgi:hypothetical protein
MALVYSLDDRRGSAGFSWEHFQGHNRDCGIAMMLLLLGGGVVAKVDCLLCSATQVDILQARRDEEGVRSKLKWSRNAN